jgi:hypothetical protein
MGTNAADCAVMCSSMIRNERDLTPHVFSKEKGSEGVGDNPKMELAV